MPKTRSRINKKNAVTFKLVHRSQRDPLIADETAPQHVLVECPRRVKEKKSLDLFDQQQQQTSSQSVEQRKTEQRKFGVYYDDDYDYLQHLKATEEFEDEQEWELVKSSVSSNDKSKLLLPSSVFESKYEDDEGMLNKAALPVGPQLDWDPEVVAAMDEDFDFNDPNNQIDDDFVTQAIQTSDEARHDVANDSKEIRSNGVENINQDDKSCNSDSYTDEDSDEGKDLFFEEETKSHFTNYSMTSSIMRRNKGLTLLDDRFETLYETEYGEDTEIGALDAEELNGFIEPNSNLIDQLFDDFDRSNKYTKSQYEVNKSDLLEKLKHIDDGEETVTIEVEESGKNREDRFDCESILSTYSNLYNHPKLIYEPKARSNKLKISSTGMPVGELGKPKLTARNLKELDMIDMPNRNNKSAPSVQSAMSRLSQLSLRPDDETPQERKARKNALKALRKERRMEKKANQDAFKQEHHRQEKEILNVRQNLACVRLV